MTNPWIQEGSRFSLLVGGAWLIGWVLGYTVLFISLAVLFYLFWHVLNLYRLHRWLQRSKKFHPPSAPGIWGEIAFQVLRLQQRNRKRKRKLTNMLKRFQSSTAAMPDAAVVLKHGATIEWFNRAAQNLLGLRSPQDIDQRVTKLLRNPQFIDYLEQGNPQDQSIKITSPVDPDKMLRVHIVPYTGQRSLLIARDITRIHRLEQVRQDFVANVSHELRTPLTVIHGFLETMLDAKDEFAPEWQRPLALMSEQTLRMQNIVNDLLLLSRVESEQSAMQTETVDVPKMLRGIVDEAKALSGERAHSFQIEIDDLLYLKGKSDELRSAFSNLVFNAVRYTPAQGHIQLVWQMEEQQACFAVHDTGEGIAEQHIPRLTERFYRVDVSRSRGQGGTGLGLAIVKHVLNRHQGQLQIKSQLNQGSSFYCYFPESLILQNNEDQEKDPI